MAGSSWIVHYGKKLRPLVNGIVARYSIDPDVPVLDPSELPWTDALRRDWQAIRDEALAVLQRPDAVPRLLDISPDHEDLVDPNHWRSFFLIGYGHRIDENLQRCPRTAAALQAVPGLNSAFFSILQPGTHILDHEGVTKGLVTCHLGLVVPPGDACRMRVEDRIVTWAPGEVLVFDDTCNHEVWNDTGEIRVILLVQAARRIRLPGRWFADLFLWGIRNSPFVRTGIRNLADWNASVREVEAGFAGQAPTSACR